MSNADYKILIVRVCVESMMSQAHVTTLHDKKPLRMMYHSLVDGIHHD
jgi:hypothetical protein